MQRTNTWGREICNRPLRRIRTLELITRSIYPDSRFRNVSQHSLRLRYIIVKYFALFTSNGGNFARAFKNEEGELIGTSRVFRGMQWKTHGHLIVVIIVIITFLIEGTTLASGPLLVTITHVPTLQGVSKKTKPDFKRFFNSGRIKMITMIC